MLLISSENGRCPARSQTRGHISLARFGSLLFRNFMEFYDKRNIIFLLRQSHETKIDPGVLVKGFASYQMISI